MTSDGTASEFPQPPAPRVRPPLGRPGLSWAGDGALGGSPARVETRPAPVPASLGGASPIATLGLTVAPLHLRILAFLVDEFLLSMVFGFVAALAGIQVEIASGTDLAGAFTEAQRQMQPIMPLLYIVEVVARWPWSAIGWSPGKRLFGLRIVDAEGNAPGLRRGLLRAAFTLGSELPFFAGFLWAVFDRERRTWHDHLATTWVVRKRD